MNVEVTYHPQVFPQITTIIDWYEEQRSGLGGLFLDDLEKAIQVIAGNPKSFAQKLKKSRQLRLKKFPYVVVYELQEDRVEVYNIVHTSRHPIRRIMKR